MKYRFLGNSGLQISEVSLGGWLTQGRTLDNSQTREIVLKAFDLGINFFDTADVYNLGEAEKALAPVLKELKRQHYVVGTKCFFPFSEGITDRGNNRKHIVESVNDSLRRLQLDHIDLMQFHRWDPNCPLEETIRAIEDLLRSGKVLYWGSSEWSGEQIRDMARTADKLNMRRAISNQPHYNMFTRGIESEVLPACEELGLGNVVWSPLAQGVLTGKYLPGQPSPQGSRGADDKSNTFMGELLQDPVLTKVQQVKKMVEDAGYKMGQFALAWCLRQPAVTSVIVGAKTTTQIEDNAGASGLEIDPGLFAKAEQMLAN